MFLENDSNYKWTPASLLELTIKEPDDFLKIKETLTRMGIASKRDNTLYQTVHILHKRGHYYAVMFKELFMLDGRKSDISVEDISRRNTIASLLEQWGLCTIVPTEEYEEFRLPLSSVKIVSYKDKHNWNLVAKYSMRSERIHAHNESGE